MKATVYTTGKVSKKLGASVAAAVVEGLDEGPVEVTATFRENLPSPNSVAFQALALGVGVAIAKGATEVEAYSSSKNVVKATDGTGGADYATRLDAFHAAYVILWTRKLTEAGGSWTIAHRAAADMPEAVELAAGAMAEEPEPALALF